MRKIFKGNVNGNGHYSIRIIENNKVYYYNIISDRLVFGPLYELDMVDTEEVFWEDLPIKFREIHYNAIYPDVINDFQKKCFIYGEQKANEMRQKEEQQEEDKRLFRERLKSFPVRDYIAKAIYNSIGTFEKIVIVHEVWISGGEYIVDDEKYVKVEDYKVTSVKKISEVQKEKAEWGKRVEKISKLAGTSYQLATVIGNFSDQDKAVEVLTTIKQCLYSWDKEMGEGSDIRRQIRFTLIDIVPYKDYKQLNFSKKFYEAAQKIIESK